VGADTVQTVRGAAEGAVETAGEVSKDALEAAKSGLRTAASVPRDIIEAAIRGTEDKGTGRS
jgi:hypothetical protein